MSKHPTPFRFSTTLRCVVDADGWEVSNALANRALRAGVESPISRAERAVVRSACALVAAFEFPDGRFSPVFPSEHVDHITQAVDRLAAARAKAKKGAR